MTSQVVSKSQCPSCLDTGMDNLATYDDAHSYCFGCGKYFSGEEMIEDKLGYWDAGKFGPIASRKIGIDTVKKFGVKQAISGGYVESHCYPYYQDGTIQALKFKIIKNKTFTWSGKKSGVGLFGFQLFQPGSSKIITITEGELDTLAHFQMFYGFPVVSVYDGAAGAKKACEENYKYLDSFDSIVISFDDDEPGRKAAEAVRELFSHKAKVLKHVNGHKDACDYLAAKDSEAYRKAWWASEVWAPKGLIRPSEVREEVRSYTLIKGVSYPWPKLTAMTHGVMDSQFILCVAGTGIGKTTFFKELIYHFKNTTDCRIGCIFLEEPYEETILDLMSLKANKILYRPEVKDGLDSEEWDRYYNEVVEDDRILLLSYDGSEKYQTDLLQISNDIRHLSKVEKCDFIFIDHLSRMIDRSSRNSETLQLAAIAEGLDNLRLELKLKLFANIHANRAVGSTAIEEGGRVSLDNIRGSAIPGTTAQVVLAFERNTQAEDELERNTTQVRVLKIRKGGETGLADRLVYNRETGRLEVECEGFGVGISGDDELKLEGEEE